MSPIPGRDGAPGAAGGSPRPSGHALADAADGSPRPSALADAADARARRSGGLALAAGGSPRSSALADAADARARRPGGLALAADLTRPVGSTHIARPDGRDGVGRRRLALRRVEHIMGTAISVDLRDPEVDAPALDDLFAHLREVDARFSTYRTDSEVSRLARGEIAERDCSPDVRYILALCDDLARTSDGYFDARHHRADGLLDPSGVVKGWSVEEGTWILEAAGAANYMINAGGDIVTRGEPEPGHPWRIGIRHPRVPDRLAAVLDVRDRAIATSGAYERGDHIVDPHTGRAPNGMLSVTVVGPSLTYADAYATTAYAMGLPGLTWVAGHPGFDAYGITADDRVLWTPGLDRYLATDVDATASSESRSCRRATG